MRVMNDPAEVRVFEHVYSVIKTLMSVSQDSSTLSPADFPDHSRNIFDEECCAFLNSAAGRKALAPWQAKGQNVWANAQHDHVLIRAAEWVPSTESRWARSLFSSATATSTTWTAGNAAPGVVAVHMYGLHMLYATAMNAIYKAQLAELKKLASVSLEK